MRRFRVVISAFFALCGAVAFGQSSQEIEGYRDVLNTGTTEQKQAVIAKLKSSSDLTILDNLIAILKGPEVALHQAAKEACEAIPENWMQGLLKRAEAATPAEQAAIFKEWAKISNSPYYYLLGSGEFLLPVLKAEKSPAAARALLRELTRTKADDENWDLEPDEIPGGCGNYDHSREFAIARLLEKEWRYGLELLHRRDTYRTGELFDGLKNLKHPEIREAFIQLLRDPRATVRADAASSLSAQPDVEQLFARSAHDTHAAVRAAVVYAIGDRRTTEALRMSLELAFDRVAGVRVQAHYALQQWGDPFVEWYAIQEVRSKAQKRSGAAAELLSVLGTPAAKAELLRVASQKGHPARATALHWAVCEVAPKADELLIAAMNDSDPRVVIVACELADVGSRKRIEPLLEKLRVSTDRDIAQAAQIALRNMRGG